MMQNLFQKPRTWLLLTILAGGAVLVSIYFFHAAIPLVSLNISMNKSTAQHAAAQLAQRYNWQPANYYSATGFYLDEQTRNYVELEAGGNSAFTHMLQEHLYEPYTWRVRHFMPQEPRETLILFTPEGIPYGFQEKLPENAPGASLSAPKARLQAERDALDWQINFNHYSLIESSQSMNATGRVDHTFIYERPDIKIKDARLRLQLVLSGDKLTTLLHFVYKPDSFNHRYQEMRAANEGINGAGTFFLRFTYFFLGCLIGIFVLLPTGFILIQPAVWWGIGIALIKTLSMFNYMPLMLLQDYHTSLSLTSFVMQQTAQFVANFMLHAFLYSITIIAAESLTRRAFGNQLQLWKSWSPTLASSAAIIGKTLGGYLLVPFFTAYAMLLYTAGNSFLGWWSPSESLADPNILATYVPWFSPFANSLSAGFWEECLFRAVPLAGAALLGRWLGKERLFVVITLLAQAVIFGACHANYATQPSYVRIIELIIPSLAFGLVYLTYGLLPGIIAHFTYDMVWTALPLFISTAPGILFQQLMIVILTLAPLWIILLQAMRAKQQSFLHQASPLYLNSHWHPTTTAVPEEALLISPHRLAKTIRLTIFIVGILSFIGLLIFIQKNQDVPPININREEAIAIAHKTLDSLHITPGPEWTVMASLCSPAHKNRHDMRQSLCFPNNSKQHRFVWQKTNKEIYTQLLQTYLNPPSWVIRYARFKGTISERAEEYAMLIDYQGNIRRFRHKLPEEEPGAQLSEQEARKIAQIALTNRFGILPKTIIELSACSQQRPARRDWIFTFFDSEQKQLPEKSARISVTIAGNVATDAYRYVHVPEEWLRAEQQQIIVTTSIETIITFIIYALFILGSLIALIAGSRHRLPRTPLITMIGILCFLIALGFYNRWPLMMANLQTSQPIATQLFLLVATTFFPLGIITALASGFITSYTMLRKYSAPHTTLWHTILGISCGIIYVALLAAIHTLAPSLSPSIINSDSLATRFVWLGFTHAHLIKFIITLLGGLILCSLLDNCLRQKYYTTAGIIILLSGFIIHPLSLTIPLYWWSLESLIISFIFGILYWLLLRHDRAYLPALVATPLIVTLIGQAWANPFPGSFASALLSSILITVSAYIWLMLLQKHPAKNI